MAAAYVRMRLEPPPSLRHRTPDQWLAVRLPRLSRALTAGIRSLPLRSRLRRAFVARVTRLAFAAYNRRDFDAVLVLYDPRVENQVHHVSGIEGIRHGHEGWRHYWHGWFEAWDESYQVPNEVLDFSDDRVLVLGRIRCRSTDTGMELEEATGILLTFDRGAIVRHEEWFDQRAALAAAGVTRSER